MEENIVKEEKEIKKEHHKKNDKLNEKIKLLEEEKNLINEKLLRVTAEMQNIRRRYDEEISRIYKYEGESLIKKMLSTLDNFERAIDMDDDNLDDEVSKFLSGFKLIYGKLKSDLIEMGVIEIDCLGKEFNPNMMEAVMTEKIDGKDSGVVIEVLLKGYTYNDKVIRPAMVKVSE